MPIKRHSAEQIVRKLREAEVELAQGVTVKDACRKLAISEHTYYRWRREYGGLKLNQTKRLKQLEKENGRLKRLMARAVRHARQDQRRITRCGRTGRAAVAACHRTIARELAGPNSAARG